MKSSRPKEKSAVLPILIVILLASCAIGLFVGATRVPIREFFGSPIIRLRLAGVILAVVAGAGLSVAGVIFQALLRNPLAEPYILGVSSGAGLAAASVIVFVGTATVWLLPSVAFAGALITIFLVYMLARTGGAVPVDRLLLSGVIVASVFGSLLMFLVSISTSKDIHSVIWWLLGNLQIFDWSLLGIVSGVVVLSITFTILFARDLNVMTLGEEPAAHLGLNVEWTKKIFFLVASLMTGATVAACGLIGFVGLIIPHAIRLVVGPDHRRLVPASAIAGASFLVLADAFARTIMVPQTVHIGVVTAVLGGPFFLFLLRRRKTAYWR